MSFLFLLILLLYEIVFARKLLMKSGTNPWELKTFEHISIFISSFDLVFKNDQLHFHFWIYVPFFIGWPKTPKCIANDATILIFQFFPKNIFSKLHENVLPLEQLGFFFLLHPETLILPSCSQGVFHGILNWLGSLFGIIFQDQLLDLGLVPVLWGLLRPIQLFKILIDLLGQWSFH